MKDICDGDVALSSIAALEDWNAMVLAFLSHGTQTPVALGAVLERQPEFAMGHAARGLFCILMGRRELMETARQAGETVRALRAQSTLSQREAHWCNALEAWLDGRPSAAILELEEILIGNPRDTLSMKVSHAIRFVLGDGVGMRRSVERVLAAHDESHPCRGYTLGCHAFALEETGDYTAAERAGMEALHFAPDDAWGLHAVAHVYDMTGQAGRGISLIEDHDASWLHCNNFRYHVWWHKALLHLDQGDTGEVLRLYDQKIRHDKTDDYRDIANATSLLMRLELEGISVGDRWGELADLSQERSDDGCLVFADLHYMLALTGDDRDTGTARLLGRIERDAGKMPEMARIVADPGVAAATGLAAFGEGRYGVAFQHLAQARPRMQTIGGSHAQRDVFERITVDAGIRAGYFDEAQGILTERSTRRTGARDAFAKARLETIAQARREAVRIPAQ